MTAPNRIELKIGPGTRHEEAPADGVIKPGHLLFLESTGKVKVHSTHGGRGELMIAKEDALQGKKTTDAYADADVVSHMLVARGDTFLGRLPANAPAVVVGDKLMSFGDGSFTIAPAGSVLFKAVGSSAGLSNGVTTEQFFATNLYTVPANFLQVGDVLHVRGHGTVSAAAGTDTLTVKVYIGATAFVTTAATNATTGDVVVFDAYIRIRTIGASGTFVADVLDGNGVVTSGSLVFSAVASTAIDTTAANIIRASATWSATSATCTVALDDLSVELVRAGGLTPLVVAQEAIDNSAVAADAFIRLRAL